MFVDAAGVVHAGDVRENAASQRWAPGDLDALVLRQRATPHRGLATSGLPSPVTSRYDDVIAQAAERHRVPFRLVKAVVEVESGFRTDALSRAGARGLMQLMPGTARDLGVIDASDPAQCIDGGTRYLAKLLLAFHDEDIAVAAYNAGPARVVRAGGIPDIAETRAYVENVRSAAARYALEPSAALRVHTAENE